MSEQPSLGAAPEYGITVRAHIAHLMVEVDDALREVFAAVRLGKRLRPDERERLGRQLAGVIGSCETMRIWLAAGAR